MPATINISDQLIHIEHKQENNWETHIKSTVLGLFSESDHGRTHEEGELQNYLVAQIKNKLIMQQTKKNPDCCGGVLLLKIVILFTISQRSSEVDIY